MGRELMYGDADGGALLDNVAEMVGSADFVDDED